MCNFTIFKTVYVSIKVLAQDKKNSLKLRIVSKHLKSTFKNCSKVNVFSCLFNLRPNYAFFKFTELS